MEDNIKKIDLEIEPELYKKIENFADNKALSINNCIVDILQKYI